jgi:hypothetical protein
MQSDQLRSRLEGVARLDAYELYIARYRKDRQVDRSTIACEAILALYDNELK